MATVTEQAVWADNIYQIAEDDPVQGGENGVDNIPHQQLANRTAYLKKRMDDLVMPADYSQAIKDLQNSLEKEIQNRQAGDKDIPKINNTLTSDATEEALSAAQGKALKDMIDQLPLANHDNPVPPTSDADGYYRFPSGFTIQWGKYSEINPADGKVVFINFPLSFANACFSVQATLTQLVDNSVTAAADGNINVSSVGLNGAQFVFQDYSNHYDYQISGFMWLAIGF